MHLSKFAYFHFKSFTPLLSSRKLICKRPVQGILDQLVLEKFKKDFYADQKNVLAQNVCSKIDPFEAALRRKTLEETQHVFNHKVINN